MYKRDKQSSVDLNEGREVVSRELLCLGVMSLVWSADFTSLPTAPARSSLLLSLVTTTLSSIVDSVKIG